MKSLEDFKKAIMADIDKEELKKAIIDKLKENDYFKKTIMDKINEDLKKAIMDDLKKEIL